jgi:threonylcarbamoyladenosine tRNA methylthiotransferase MtaB
MKIYLDTVGCRLNQSEIEKYAGEFMAYGHILVPRAEDADVAVINTCAVTAAAASDSRQKLRKIIQDKNLRVISTGCLIAIEPGLFSTEQNVRIIDNLQKDDLVKLVLGEIHELHPNARIPVPGTRSRTRAFIKTQDGCNNFCTFCLTRIARGKARSIPSSVVLEDIRAAVRGGVKEVVLTGVQLGSWGCDLNPELHLKDLVEQIITINGDFRIRFSSIEPWDVDSELIMIWQKDLRLCRHFHLPLQSGSEATLKRMARHTTPKKYEALIHQIHELLPDATITTDVIVGFPGETEDEFSESLDYVKRMGFSGGHVFTYSPREGTPAARYPDQVTQLTKKERGRLMRQVLTESGRKIRSTSISCSVKVLWEGMRKIGDNNWRVAGLTDNNHRVSTEIDRAVNNQVLPTRLVEITDEGFIGEIIMQLTQEGR